MIAGVAAGEELNVALGRTARQISTRDETSPARAALDGNDTTAACTGNRQGHPWWAVDLGQHYIVHHVIITSAAERRNYAHTHTNRPNTPFTRYNRLSNPFDNRFDNRVERTANVRATGCQTGLYNRFDNRLYRVCIQTFTRCQTGLTTGLTTGLIKITLFMV